MLESQHYDCSISNFLNKKKKPHLATSLVAGGGFEPPTFGL